MVFTFVRNPWARAVSQIEYLKGKRIQLFSSASFKENLQIYCNSDQRPWGHDLGACQLDYLLDKTGMLRVDFIGRFELLDADFATICTRLAISPVPILPHVFNAGRTRHYHDYYDDESRGWVASRFARDIAQFGYEF